MGWFDRMFGKKHEEPQAVAPEVAAEAAAIEASGEAIPAERVGLNGEYDQSGLAKRVVQAFDNTSGLDDIETLWVAQTSGTVVFKGAVPNEEVLAQMVGIASGIDGATGVDTSQVTVG
jgi:hypothetical protein